MKRTYTALPSANTRTFQLRCANFCVATVIWSNAFSINSSGPNPSRILAEAHNFGCPPPERGEPRLLIGSERGSSPQGQPGVVPILNTLALMCAGRKKKSTDVPFKAVPDDCQSNLKLDVLLCLERQSRILD
jgi:hypothetical protein